MSQPNSNRTSDDVLPSSTKENHRTANTKVSSEEVNDEENSSFLVQLSPPLLRPNAAARRGQHSSASPSSMEKEIPEAESFSGEMLMKGDRKERKRSSRHRGIHHRRHFRRPPSATTENNGVAVSARDAEGKANDSLLSKGPHSFSSASFYLPTETDKMVVSSLRSSSVPVSSAAIPFLASSSKSRTPKRLSNAAKEKHKVDEESMLSSANRKDAKRSEGSSINEVVEVSVTRERNDIYPFRSHFPPAERLSFQHSASSTGRRNVTPPPHLSTESAVQRTPSDLSVVTTASRADEEDGDENRVEEDVANNGTLPPSASEGTMKRSSTPPVLLVHRLAPVNTNPFHPHTERVDMRDSFPVPTSHPRASDSIPLHGGGTLENTISAPLHTANASFVPASAVADLGGEKKYRSKMKKFASKIRGSAVPPFSYYPRFTEFPSCRISNESFVASPACAFPPVSAVTSAPRDEKIDGGSDVAPESTQRKRRIQNSTFRSSSPIVHFDSSTNKKGVSQETERTVKKKNKRRKNRMEEEDDNREDISRCRSGSERNEAKGEQMKESSRRSSHDDTPSPHQSRDKTFPFLIRGEASRRAIEDPLEMSSPFYSPRHMAQLNAASSLFFNSTKHSHCHASLLSPLTGGLTDISPLLRLEGRLTEHQRFSLPTCPPYRIPLYDQTVFKYVFGSLYAERITLSQLVFLVTSLAVFVVNILMTVVNVLFTLTLADEISLWIRAVARVCFILEFAIVLACVVGLGIVYADAFWKNNIGTSLAHDTSTLITIGGSFSVLRFFGLATPVFALRRIVPVFKRANTKKDYFLGVIAVLLWICVCFVSFLVLVSKLAQVYFALALSIRDWTLVDYVRFVGLCLNISRVDDSYFKEMSVLLDAVHRHYYFPGEVQEIHPYEKPCLLSRLRIHFGIPNYMYYTLFDTIYNFHWRSKYEREELVRQFLRAEKTKHKNFHESMRSDQTGGEEGKSTVDGKDVLREFHEGAGLFDAQGYGGARGGHTGEKKDWGDFKVQDASRKGRREEDETNPRELHQFLFCSSPDMKRPTIVPPQSAFSLDLASSQPFAHEGAATRFRRSGGVSEENELCSSSFSGHLHTVGKMRQEMKDREKGQGRNDGYPPPGEPASPGDTFTDLTQEKNISARHFSGAPLVELVEKIREVSSDEPSLLTTCLSRRQRFWLMLNYLAFIFEVDPVQLRRYLQMVQSPLPFYQLGRDAFMKSFIEGDIVGMDTAVRHSEPQSSSTAKYALRDPQQFFPSFTCDDGRRVWNTTACAELWNRRDMERTREMVHCFQMAEKYK